MLCSCLKSVQFILQLIFQSGVWKEINHELDEENDELKELASELPGVILNSRADSTCRQYSGAFIKWCSWAHNYGKSKLPAEPFYVSLYLIHLSHNANTPSPVTNGVSAISWAHKLAGHTDPCSSSIVKNTVEGLKRNLASPLGKKEPITPDILENMYDLYCGDLSIKNFLHIRTMTMCLVAYMGFLRFDELSKIRKSHISFHPTHMKILIPSSKTDVYRDGNLVYIARISSRLCAVKLLSVYLNLGQIQNDDDFIFRNISATKQGYKLREGNQPMSYTRVREILLDSLRPIVGDVSRFCVHSLRSGGASQAAKAGVPDRLFRRHGRWKSEIAKDGYVKESMSNLLSVSKSLGL